MNTKRSKKRIPDMLPEKKWLSLDEACAYMDMGKTLFASFAIEKMLSISSIGKKKYYRVAELDKAIENNIIHTQTA